MTVEKSEPAPQGSAAVLLPPAADAPESEPNDRVSQANQLQLGHGVSGTLAGSREDYDDWYVIDLHDSDASDLTAKIRSMTGGCRMILFDAREEEIDDTYCNQDGGARNIDFFAADNDTVFIRAMFNGGSASSRASYELFISER